MFSMKVTVYFVASLMVCSSFEYLRDPEEFLKDDDSQVFNRIRRGVEYVYDVPDSYISLEESYPEQLYRIRRDVFGSKTRTPLGGKSQTVGYQAGPAWGSLSQTSIRRGVNSPITVSGGAGYVSPKGHGISGSLAAQPGRVAQGSVRGQIGIINTDKHQVTAWAQHERNLNKDLKAAGIPTNSYGVNYQNKNNGAEAFVSASHTKGLPNTGSFGGSYPVFKEGNTRIDVTAQSNVGQGMKPDPQVGVQFSHQFD